MEVVTSKFYLELLTHMALLEPILENIMLLDLEILLVIILVTLLC